MERNGGPIGLSAKGWVSRAKAVAVCHGRLRCVGLRHVQAVMPEYGEDRIGTAGLSRRVPSSFGVVCREVTW